MIKLILLVLVVMMVVMVVGLVTVMLSRRSAIRRANRVPKLQKAEWSSTVYSCAESRGEF